MKKKLFLISAITLASAGLLITSSEIANADSYKDRLYKQGSTEKKWLLRYKKDNAKLDLRNILGDYKEVLKEHYQSENDYYRAYYRLIMTSNEEKKIDEYLEKLRAELDNLRDNVNTYLEED
ncbi:hypothetical protein ACVRWQ_07025 [Streptococcus phocae subsp. salmonis]